MCCKWGNVENYDPDASNGLRVFAFEVHGGLSMSAHDKMLIAAVVVTLFFTIAAAVVTILSIIAEEE